MVNEEYVMRINSAIAALQRIEKDLQEEADTTPPYPDRDKALYRIKKIQLAVGVLCLGKPVR